MKRLFVGLALSMLAAAGLLWWLNVRGDGDGAPASAATPGDTDRIARGAYLARAGNCQDCHTSRGGLPFAGGRGIPTPFGKVYSSNLTPDVAHGLGAWTAADFRRALHNGRSRDGRLLYPAFPYDAYTRVSDADADALLAYLRSLAPVPQPNRPHALRFPYDSQLALAIWRALYFRPGRFESDAAQSAAWNRGAYLVQGLGHCAACHAERNALGATRDALGLAGGLIPQQNWLAPPLHAARGAGVSGWPATQVAALLKNGVAEGAALLGPMAEVALHSTQHLLEADLMAMADYLRSLPEDGERPVRATPAPPVRLARGEKLYETHCADCHGAQGQGVAGAYLPLAGNRSLRLDPPANLVQVVLGGAFPPSTAGNPRPFGMPPFANVLDDEDVAAVLSYVRQAWGNSGRAVDALDVQRYRGSVRP